MAPAPTRPPRRSDRGGVASARADRLAELVTELSGSDAVDAAEAINAVGHRSGGDPFDLVAHAMTELRHRPLEPQDRFRVVGFLRPGDRRLPRRRPSGARETDEGEHQLVHHGSLRRWERSGTADGTAGHDVTGTATVPSEQIIDLRDRTARFRRPGPGAARS